MTLTNRLTTYSLVALALVLAVFSIAIYLLARTHLYRHLHDRAQTTLATLIAAAEVEADGIEWEPKDRRILLQTPSDSMMWTIFTAQGSRIDGTESIGLSLPESKLEKHSEMIQRDGKSWLLAQSILRHPHPEAVKPDIEPGKPRYHSLVFVVALSVTPIQETLAFLGWSLFVVSSFIMIVAGVVARWICRKVLAPVSRMTECAKRISADELEQRLPVSATRDELQELALAFNGLLSRLHDSFERQRRFTGEASHQLRTPLTAMLGQMEVAIRREREPADYQRALRSAITQAERLRQIVEMLLFLARADAESRHMNRESILLNSWLPEHLETAWETHARYSDFRIEFESDKPLSVMVQPALWEQALDNLLENALKYSSKNQQILIQVEDVSQAIQLRVVDKGIGISAQDLPYLFEPFFRSQEARQLGIVGVGLGLAITARIVAALGGTISAESVSGSGSTFTIHLPHPDREEQASNSNE